MPNNTNTVLQVQVRFAQGLIKTFLAPRDVLLADFRRAVEAYGSKLKSVRFLPDLDAAAAQEMARGGNAVLIGIRREEPCPAAS